MNTVVRRKPLLAIWLVVAVLFFILFTYSSLNLKNIDYGYRLQELAIQSKRLSEEIDQLRAQKAQLLNLERVERIARSELGFQYPEPGQLIVWEVEDHENK